MTQQGMISDADGDIAALVYATGDRPDLVLLDFARHVSDSGRRIRGLIQFRDRPSDDTRRGECADGVVRAAPRRQPDALPRYASAMIEITDPQVVAASGARFHPMVVETGDPADEVPGTLFLITAAELAAADAYEVSAYKRIEVVLKSGKSAWVYVKA
jgi:hypothetical protein